MQLKFPLPDVKIEISSDRRKVSSPEYDNGIYRLNQTEFSMEVKGVGWFYASNGTYIHLVLEPKATKASVELYLNGSTYGAILHQRQIMPIHGSSFVYNNKGIMLCGESGAGKSSLTTSFCKIGSQFLTDDVSPIIFRENMPYILPLSDRIKLWQDSLEQLQYSNEKLTQIKDNYNKFYLPVETSFNEPYPLNMIFVITTHKDTKVKITEVRGTEKFESLRNEIYRWEYLKGMKATEVSYLKKIIDLNLNTKTFKVSRPENIKIDDMRSQLIEHIERSEPK